MAEILDSFFYGFDTAIFSAVCSVQNEFLNGVANFCVNLGNMRAYVILLLAAIIMCCFKKTRKYGLAMGFALLIGGLITNIILKPVIARPRPYVGLKDTAFWPIYESFYEFAGSYVEGDLSFPSGHTTIAFETSVSIFSTARSDGKRWAYPLLILAIIIGLSRIYLCVHYPTDVIAGLIVGTLAGLFGFLITRYIYKRREMRKI